ncbi:hypothetical protein [Microterricola viridarii]|uniref:Uncharacterized protein n=1 Tax=Microterricola viridarii TaxID=412690 RepID=A0A109QXD2_9MICO|nr:hypothetical protein [Microterricola viridarii]AMB59479.1 hypothetical protein AWU67_12095 [Microterricola viridarii]
MTRTAIGVTLSVALLLALTACAPPAGEPGAAASPPPSSPSVDPTPPAATGLLGCDDLVGADAVATVLTGADGARPTPVPAVQPSAAFDSALLGGVGGLACSWRVGEGQQRLGSGDGDWAYLQLSVLPGAAAQWAPVWAGDMPSTDTIEVGGVTASVAEGETGWKLSAPVGDAWVSLAVRASGLTAEGSRFLGMPDGAVAAALAAVAEESFGVLTGAAPERLAWPTLPTRSGDAACTGGLDEAGIVAALQIDPGAVTGYTVDDARASAPSSLEGAARAVAGVFGCELRTEGFGMTTITVVREFAPALGAMSDGPDTAVAFAPLSLAGAVPPEAAIVAVRDDGPRAPVYFTVGGTLYEVYSDGAQTVAEAIIAQTR